MKTKDKAVIFLAIFGLFTCLTDGAQASHIRRVLILNSYHPTYEWTETVVNGVESTLQQYEGKVEIDIEYMDTKYFRDEKHYENLYALYKNKARRKQYDVVLASDNYALLFLLRYRDELYPNVSIVFCGVDRYHGSMLESQPREFDIDSLLHDQDSVTGVIESLDHESSIKIALKLHPSAKRVIIVHDGMSDQRYWPALSKGLVQKFSGRVELVGLLLTEPTFGGLLEEIGRLDDESIVYFADTFRNVRADLYFSEDELEMLRQRCTAPIYVLTERWFGYNLVIGGKINSGFHQGQAAAKMVMRILDGDSVRNIPILWEGPTRYMFDYIQMKRFGVSTADLPEGSIVINEPKSFYYLYKSQIWAVTATIAALTVMVIILSANILRRMAAEKKLREEREKAQKYLDVAATIMVVIEPDQKVTLINKKGCEILGYSEEEILGQKWFDNFTPEGVREQMRASFQQFMAGEKELVKHNERPVLTKSKQERIIAWHNAVLTGEDGNIVSLLASGVDITERKQVEEKLRENEERFRALTEGTSDWIWEVDINGVYTYVSPRVKELLGYEPEEIVGKTPFDLMPPEEAKRVAAEFQAYVESQKPIIRLENKNLDKEGRLVILETNGMPVFDSNGQLCGYRGIDRDITERKRAEEKLRDYQRQLKSLASELSLTEERERRRIATELHDRISQFLVISKVKLETLCESASGELAKAISEVCDSLDQTIQDTRSLTSDLSSPILYELGFEAAVAEWLAEQIRQKHGIATEFRSDGQPKPLDDDICALLFRNVRELLINVVKHARAHKVKVSVRKVNNEVCVSVEDDGVGFNPAEVASLAARTGGFGLFSIRERLEQVGGHLQIESAPGCGTKITIMAPLKQEKIKSEARE